MGHSERDWKNGPAGVLKAIAAYGLTPVNIRPNGRGVTFEVDDAQAQDVMDRVRKERSRQESVQEREGHVFEIRLSPGNKAMIEVSPLSKLTAEQAKWLKDNKAILIETLEYVNVIGRVNAIDDSLKTIHADNDAAFTGMSLLTSLVENLANAVSQYNERAELMVSRVEAILSKLE